jgi:hypothetical protein
MDLNLAGPYSSRAQTRASALAEFLASARASYLTGTVVRMGGAAAATIV